MTETPPSEATVKNRTPRWMWVVLVASVGLNLLVLGAATAAMVHFHWAHGGRGGPGGTGSGIAAFIDRLPAERQAKLRALLDERRNLVRPLRRTLREARRRARDAFVAEPFDRDALVRAYEDAANARMALTNARQKWFEDLAQVMTADERREFLKTRRYHRGHRRWRDR